MTWLPGLPDWRNAQAYAFLLRSERPVFAWEWLRRQPAYRAAASPCCLIAQAGPTAILTEQVRAHRWGLHTFEDPARSAERARPVWRLDRHPFVLQAQAETPRLGRDSFALDRHLDLATLVAGRGAEHLLLSDGCRSIRIDVQGASLLRGPVQLNYRLSGIATAKPALLVLRRWLVFASSGRFSPGLHFPDPRARRQTLILRAYDALQDRADQREIAAELLSRSAARGRWRVNSPSLRSQAQRLVRAARRLGQGEFWALLS